MKERSRHQNSETTNRIGVAALYGELDLVDPQMFETHYEEIYRPFCQLFGSEVVLQQFHRDKFLLAKISRQTQIESEKKSKLDLSPYKKHSKALRAEEVYKIDSEGFPALLAATWEGLYACFNILNSPFCNAGVINAIEKNSGFFALFNAVRDKNYDLVRLLCLYNADVNQKTKTGLSPLHFAANLNQLSIAKHLIANEAILNIQDNKGKTPLHCAVEKEHYEMAKFLFELGADPYIKSFSGETVFDLIKLESAQEFEFLKKIEIDFNNAQVLACFICFSSLIPVQYRDYNELHKMFKQLQSLMPDFSLTEAIQNLPISEEMNKEINNILISLENYSASKMFVDVATTNRADVLDPALIRPNRLDKQVIVPLPDIRGTEQILKVPLAKVQIEPIADLPFAQGALEFYDSDLDNLTNESALFEPRDNKPKVEIKTVKPTFKENMSDPLPGPRFFNVETNPKQKTILQKTENNIIHYAQGFLSGMIVETDKEIYRLTLKEAYFLKEVRDQTPIQIYDAYMQRAVKIYVGGSYGGHVVDLVKNKPFYKLLIELMGNNQLANIPITIPTWEENDMPQNPDDPETRFLDLHY